MAEVRKQIAFHESMTENKRADGFAYLRRNVLNSGTPGLYPAKDFVLTNPTLSSDTHEIIDILGSTESAGGGNFFQIKVIVEESSSSTGFYNLGSSFTSTYYSGTVRSAVFGSDGIYFAAVGNRQVRRVNYASSGIDDIGSLAPTGFAPTVGAFDGLNYWWLEAVVGGGGSIYVQDPGLTPIKILNGKLPVGILRGVDFYQNYMVLFYQQGADINVYWWDKANSTFFYDRKKVKNARFIAGGVVSGQLMMVYGVGNSQNLAEYQGQIIISAFDGNKFKKLNSLAAGRNLVQMGNSSTNWVGRSFTLGSEVLVFGVNENDRKSGTKVDIWNNYIYKIKADGSIEAQTLPVPNGTAGNDMADLVRIFFDYTVYTMAAAGGEPRKIYINQAANQDFDEYISNGPFTETTYITNFLEHSRNFHKLSSLSISFERLFRNEATSSATDEELDIYYRTSDRVGWTLMANINAQKVIDNVNKRLTAPATVPVQEQRYQITTMPDGSPLPQFNEIQFKFHSKRGFSVTDAWYEFDYLSRNTISP